LELLLLLLLLLLTDVADLRLKVKAVSEVWFSSLRVNFPPPSCDLPSFLILPSLPCLPSTSPSRHKGVWRSGVRSQSQRSPGRIIRAVIAFWCNFVDFRKLHLVTTFRLLVTQRKLKRWSKLCYVLSTVYDRPVV